MTNENEAPERIWAHDHKLGSPEDKTWWHNDDVGGVEYTRADLSDAKDTRINELEAKLHIYEGFNGQPVSSTGMVDEMADALIVAALEAAAMDLRVFAPHEEYNTGPEHDIGYASGYHTALSRIRALAADPEARAAIKAKAGWSE